jgi:hypothetical protein
MDLGSASGKKSDWQTTRQQKTTQWGVTKQLYFSCLCDNHNYGMTELQQNGNTSSQMEETVMCYQYLQ